MKKYILVTLLSVIIMPEILSQSKMRYSQFINSQISVNPAYAGARNAVSGIIMYRKQWEGIKGAPEISGFNIHAPISRYNLGLGAIVNYQTIGLHKFYNASAVFSYSLNFSSSTLNFGISGGIDSYEYDINDINVIDSDISFTDNLSYTSPNFGFGLYYFSNNYFVGLSAPKLLYTAEDYNKNRKSEFELSKIPVYLYGGYVFDVGGVKVKPSVLLESYTGSSMRYDAGVSFYFMSLYGIGAYYRSTEDIVGYFEIELLKGLVLSYSYDYSTKNIGSISDGSHEITLRYDITFKKRVRSMRYF